MKATVTCAACGHTNRNDARYCAQCGGTLNPSCSECGRQLQADARFCDTCGAKVAQSAARSSAVAKSPVTRVRAGRAASAGERKQVTVLFADVVDSTVLGERLDPEEMRDVMDGCFRLLMEQVHRYDGSVTQFTGDGLMALFGAPVAHEHAPERAVRAGIDMQAAVKHYSEDLLQRRGIEFRIRVGINTGLVVVGNIGDDLHADYTAIGDTTNLAARLQAAAAPGSVVVSGTTAKFVAGRFVTRALPPLTLKGKTRPVMAYEVLRALPRAPLVAAGDTGLTPLVGRKREIETLQKIFAEVLAGHGQVVLLAGEAGIGKSRLLYEVRTRPPAAEGVWLVGRCVSFGSGMPLLPIIDLLKSGFEIEDGDAEGVVGDKLARGLGALQVSFEAVLPYLRLLLSLDPGDARIASMDAGARHFGTLNALKRVLFAQAELRPLVILLEDLHWIDRASEEFLAYVVDSIPPARILLLCTHRPEYRAGFAERSFVTRLSLQPLGTEETARLASAVLDGGVPDSVRRLIVDRADGNPFFVEEITKTLLEVGALRRTSKGLIAEATISDNVVPDTIQGVIMARIDRLGDEPKLAIQVASVIGREFALRLLARAAELGDRTSSLLGELRALELIYEKSGVPELAYMFKHALTHDVAYESLLLQRRRQLHRTIGMAVEELYADRLAEHWETLAHHFYRAEEWERAFSYLFKAGKKASESFANSAAIDFYDRALEVATHLNVATADRAEILQQKALAHLCVSQFPEAIAAYRAALDLTTDSRERARIQAFTAIALWYAHDFDEATTVAAEALATARALDDAEIAAQASCAIGVVQMVRGELEEAAVAFDAACDLGVGTDPVFGSWALSAAALKQNWHGEYRPAIARLEQLVDEAKEANQLWSLTQIASHLAITLGGAGEYQRALASLRESIAVAESIGEKFWRGRMWNTSGWIHGEIGAYDAADEANRRCLEIALELGSLRAAPELVGNARCNLADLALERGKLASVEQHLEVVAGILGDSANQWMTWRYSMHFHLSAGELHLRRGDQARAHEVIERALTAAARTGSRRYTVRGLRLLAEWHEADGDLEGAESIASRAVAEARALANPPQLWRALLAHARILDRCNQPDESDRCHREAREVLTAVASALPGELRAVLHASDAGRAALV